MLKKNKRIISALLVLTLLIVLSSLFINPDSAAAATGKIENIIVEKDDKRIIVPLGNEDGYARAYSTKGPLFNWLKGSQGYPKIHGIQSGAKFMLMGGKEGYASNFSKNKTALDAMNATSSISEDEINTFYEYKEFNGDKTVLTTIAAKKVAYAKEKLDLGNLSKVTNKLTLPTTKEAATITWSSDKPAIISNAGKVTRPLFQDGDATVTLTATLKVGKETATKTFSVTVLKNDEIKVSAISVDQQDQTITVGATLELSVTFDPTNATNKNVTWASSDTDVATVDENGLVTAVAAGTATITVTSDDGGFTDTVEITVAAAPDTTAPVLEEVTLTTDENDNLVLTVKASDNAGLASLEVDHSLEGTLPEFTVGTEDATDETTGASSSFADGTWTLNFGPTVSAAIRANTEEITFYFVITDVNGNKFGSMDPTTPENTETFDVPASVEAEALAAAVDGTTMTGDLSALTATFPESVPEFFDGASYKINSEIELDGDVDGIITITRDGTDLVIEEGLKAGTYTYTELVQLALGGEEPSAADFDTSYSGKEENYAITVSGNTEAIDTTVTIRSIISDDEFSTREVLAELTGLELKVEAMSHTVTTVAELEAALANTDVTDITVTGTLGSDVRETGYTIYNVDRAVTIQGAAGAKVFGSFVITSPDVTVKDLEIQNRGDAESPSEGNTAHRIGFKVDAKNVTLTNNKLTNGLGGLAGLSNAIQIRSNEEGSSLSDYVLEDNEIIGHESSWGADWTSTGVFITEGYGVHKAITADLAGYKNILAKNTFTNNAIDLTHTDYTRANGTLYKFRLPLGRVTSLNEKIEEAKEKVEANYTAETWTVLQTALTQAETVAGNIDTKTEAQDGTYTVDIILAKEALEEAIDGLVDPSKTTATTAAELEAALANTDVTDITVTGTLGSDVRETGYTIYNVDRAVTIQGAAGAKVFGSFVITSPDVTVKDLEIQNRGDAESPSEGNTAHRIGFKVDAKNVTLTNNKLTNGLGGLAGLSNAIQIRSNEEGSSLSDYVLEDNEIIGHESSWGADWTSTGVFITEGYGVHKAITADLAGYKNILAKNTFTNNAIDLTHTDYTRANGTLYKFRLPLGRVTSLNEKIEEAKEKVEANYTAETWTVLQTALTQAETVAGNIDTKTEAQDGTYTVDIILAKEALEEAIDGLVDPSKTTATTAAELEAALANTDVTDITVTGTLGSDVRETGYTIYNVDRAVTIQGAAGAKVFGSFVITSPDVTVKDLEIQNRGDAESPSEGNTAHRIGFKVDAKNVTLTNNKLTNGLGGLAGLSNAIQIRSNEEGSSLSDYVLEDNEIIGHDSSWEDTWTSTGVFFTEGYGVHKAITADLAGYKNILAKNTFTNNAIDLTHTDYTRANGTLYKFRLPLGRVTSLNEKIEEAKEKVEANYTAETWTVLQTALTQAETVAGNIDTKTEAQDGTYTVDIILAKEALEEAIDGLVDPSKTTATTAAELEAALANTDVTDITVTGTLGSDVRETGYTIYNVDRAVTIQGAAGAKVFGSFVITSPDVTVKDLEIQNRGDAESPSEGNTAHRIGFKVDAKNVTLTNNKLTNGLGGLAGLSNAIQIRSNEEGSSLSDYVLEDNEIIGHESSWGADWTSTGVFITEGYGVHKAITADLAGYKNILAKNTFTNNAIDLTHTDYTRANGTLYKFRLPLGRVTSLNEKIEEAKEKVEANYTAETWTVLQTALTQAETVAGNIDTKTEAQDGTYTVDIILAKEALEEAIDGLVDPSKTTATTAAELEAALANTDVTDITVTGTLGSDVRETGYTIYNVDRAVTIQGAAGAKVFGSFVITSPDVTVKDLEIQNRGDAESPSEGNTAHRIGFKVDAKNVTLTNNKLTNGLGGLAGLSNAIQIRSNEEGSSLSDYVLEDNEIIGHESSWGADWTSTGVFITEGYGVHKAITADLAGYKNILAKNTFTNNAIDLTHTDYTRANGTLYKFRLPLGRVTSLNEKIEEAKEKVEANYTAETWTVLQTALTQAETVAGNIDTKTEAQDGTYTVDIILAKEALEEAIDGLVDPSKAVATNNEQLEAALTNADVTEITVEGNIGGEDAYTIYNVNRAVTIKGKDENAKVYGSFIIKADGVTIDNLEIQNKGDLTGESSTNRGGIYVFAENVTLTNNTITNGLATEAGLSNAIQIMSPTENNPLSSYVITDNTLTGHDNTVPNWSSSGIVIAQNYTPGSIGEYVKAITATEDDYASLLSGNTFTNNKIDLTHQDWSKTGDDVVLYPYPVDEE